MTYWTKRRKIVSQVDRYIQNIEQSCSEGDQEQYPSIPENPVQETPDIPRVNNQLELSSDKNNELPNVSGANNKIPAASSTFTEDVEQAPYILSDDDDDDEQLSPPFISSSEFSDTDDDNSNLRSDLADWAVQHKITHGALSGLLGILRKENLELPKDPRTLLGTNVKVVSKNLEGGCYYHIGIETGILSQLAKNTDIRMGTSITLQVNVDGLPIFKSSNAQFWPILGLIECMKNDIQTNKEPFIIGLYYGKSKPASIEQYFQDFVEETCALQEKGVTYLDKYYHFQVSAFICDAPARAFVKQIKGHNAYSGCDKCTQPGTYNGKVTFPETSAILRTDDSFADRRDTDHHNGTTPLSALSLGMVSQFPMDYMHLVCLGVVRKLLLLWRRGPLVTRIGPRVIEQISTVLKSMHSKIPCEFNRKPRPVEEFERWKATELRQFLLYTGPVCLLQHLPEELYNNFLLLSVGINILLSASLHTQYLEYAHSLLVLFVQHFGELYGQNHITYNVHGLVHLSEEARKFGVLDNISAFPFENFLSRVKRMVRKPNSPLEQVVRRLSEENERNKTVSVYKEKFLCKPHRVGPVPGCLAFKDQYAEMHLKNFTLKVSEGDNCVQLRNKDVVVVQNIIADDQHGVRIVYRKFRELENFFTYPLDSKKLNIFRLSNLNTELNVCAVTEIAKKYVLLPFRGVHIGLPLLHL